MNKTELQKETVTQNEQQSGVLNHTEILLNIEIHLKSIADSLNKITENGIDVFQKSWRG